MLTTALVFTIGYAQVPIIVRAGDLIWNDVLLGYRITFTNENHMAQKVDYFQYC